MSFRSTNVKDVVLQLPINLVIAVNPDIDGISASAFKIDLKSVTMFQTRRVLELDRQTGLTSNIREQRSSAVLRNSRQIAFSAAEGQRKILNWFRTVVCH